MADGYFQLGSERATQVERLFERIARRYDLINDVQSLGLHRWWKDQTIRLADIRPGDRALDVCCGTGDLTFRLAAAGARATGLDFSHGMLGVAQKRRARAPQSDVEFVQGDALKLPFNDNQFNAVTIGYGLRNLADISKGLSEMHRVLKPGGRLVVLECNQPDSVVWRTLYFTYLRVMVPVFGVVFCGDAHAYRYLLQSLRHYPGARSIAETMKQMGFASVQVRLLIAGTMSINVGLKEIPVSPRP